MRASFPITMVFNLSSKLYGLVFEGWSCRWDDRITEDNTIRMVTTFLAAMLAISWCAWLIRKSRAPPSPPGSPVLPVLGSLPLIEPDFHCYFAKLSQIYGPLSSSNWEARFAS
ncbi:hypothetical protein Ddye_013454 [Dipteronia dyeriana]|uniref:Cytochrome P450 n=1 Tax=Dipteronia dyeriana TaxID=168575 RepID=A0AAD9X696_9ROSI|nr:hypothetical protein Ddye_013454 [Dipteronia dyeriana]